MYGVLTHQHPSIHGPGRIRDQARAAAFHYPHDTSQIPHHDPGLTPVWGVIPPTFPASECDAGQGARITACPSRHPRLRMPRRLLVASKLLHPRAKLNPSPCTPPE